jgi:trans-aconitate 2-methyltransferase
MTLHDVSLEEHVCRMPWNPDRYHQFRSERAAPFEDLLGLIERRDGLSVVDLGCGPGELTQRLADELPASEVVGIDSSEEMLERAVRDTRPGLRFELGDIATVSGQWDLVFSHAAIQWLDHHETLVPRLMTLVRPGGQLTVQVPSNQRHPALVYIRDVAGEEPFSTALGGYNRDFPVLSVDRYADLLYESGGTQLTVFEKVYPHVLQDADALADWSLGTALVPYLERLPADLHDPFLNRYRAKLQARWPGSPVFYGFRRILFAATVPG